MDTLGTRIQDCSQIRRRYSQSLLATLKLSGAGAPYDIRQRILDANAYTERAEIALGAKP